MITYQRNVNKLKSFKEEPLDNSFLKKRESLQGMEYLESIGVSTSAGQYDSLLGELQTMSKA